MILLACDQSVRGFAIAAAPLDWGGDWSKVKVSRTDGGSVKRGDGYAALQRLHTVFGWVETAVCDLRPDVVGFESYGFSARPDTHVVELVGALKLWLYKWRTTIETVNQSSARKLILGKVPRKGEEAKAAVWRTLHAAGMPATFDEDMSDALCILNHMLHTRDGYHFAQNA